MLTWNPSLARSTLRQPLPHPTSRTLEVGDTSSGWSGGAGMSGQARSRVDPPASQLTILAAASSPNQTSPGSSVSAKVPPSLEVQVAT